MDACILCLHSGHLFENCPNCHYCGLYGHYKRQCPERPKPRSVAIFERSQTTWFAKKPIEVKLPKGWGTSQALIIANPFLTKNEIGKKNINIYMIQEI
ncbi:hypothetical protein B4U79_18182 [Dinothrombium tinctorium]|uniref:CCHC-type domain-containing protein n=1 Tax=Dinothrombium tinctorium TaxID=1965070 RepID=A0A3S3RYH4_9ACAR|nr:hypothetical protein B4U79_18195 [Dinothrombium tinctorium]RWS08083.1 hypothetical protein B4U79_18182 [Dinothrombium tinctorium]